MPPVMGIDGFVFFLLSSLEFIMVNSMKLKIHDILLVDGPIQLSSIGKCSVTIRRNVETSHKLARFYCRIQAP